MKRSLLRPRFIALGFVLARQRLCTAFCQPPCAQRRFSKRTCRHRSAGFQTCCIADFQVGKASNFVRLAGLETRDTAQRGDAATKGARLCRPDQPQQFRRAEKHLAAGGRMRCGWSRTTQPRSVRSSGNRCGSRRFGPILIDLEVCATVVAAPPRHGSAIHNSESLMGESPSPRAHAHP